MSENVVKATVRYDEREHTYDTPDQEVVKNAVVAVSGGMDSATCLFHAIKLYGKENVVGVSMFYGQRHDVELSKAKAECEKLGVKFYELNLTPIFSFNKNISALLAGSEKEIVQNKDYATIMHEKIEKGEAPISDEYIPNRNSLFLNTLCSIGLQVFENHPFAVFTGIHSDDVLKQEGSNVGAYPDCSEEFALATNKALQLATAGLCYVYAPLANKTKAQVAEFGVANGMTKEDFNDTWSCYKGVEATRTKQCGKCPTCVAEGTLIYMANGTLKKIEDIKPGDIVWSMGEDYKAVATKVVELLDQGEKECFRTLNGLELTADHLIYSPHLNHRKAGYHPFENLGSEDKAVVFDMRYATENSDDYKKGYLRGFVDGDGHIGERGVFTCQKEKDILEEFWDLYKDVVAPSEAKVSYDENRDMYVCEGGHSKKFEEVTSIQFTEEYAKGYIAGMLISDGCACFNKSTSSFRYIIAQSISANPEKCEIIEKMLNLLDISYCKWQEKSFGFNKEGSLMNYYGISKPWRLPLVYGASKKEKMLQKINSFGSLKFMPKEKLGEKISVGIKHVYDINTETHSFFANGVLVHNCIDRIHALVDGGVFTSIEDITENYDLTAEEAAKYFN